MQHLALSEVALDALVIVEEVQAERALAVRLMELGLVAGTPVKIRRKAPLGDPLELELRGYSLSIRTAEAKLVRVSLPEAAAP